MWKQGTGWALEPGTWTLGTEKNLEPRTWKPDTWTLGAVLKVLGVVSEVLYKAEA